MDAANSCARGGDTCLDNSLALTLKLIAIGIILVMGVMGISIPLVGKNRRFLKTDGSLFFAMKAFAAGVILATGYVHMLSDGSAALTDPCLPDSPWSKFPFSGFIAMLASLATLLVEFMGTQFYERRQRKRVTDEIGPSGLVDSESGFGIETSEGLVDSGSGGSGKVFGEEDGGGMHIVGIHAHAAHHRHNHAEADGHVSHGHGHGHGIIDLDDSGEGQGMRHVVVAQV